MAHRLTGAFEAPAREASFGAGCFLELLPSGVSCACGAVDDGGSHRRLGDALRAQPSGCGIWRRIRLPRGCSAIGPGGAAQNERPSGSAEGRRHRLDVLQSWAVPSLRTRWLDALAILQRAELQPVERQLPLVRAFHLCLHERLAAFLRSSVSCWPDQGEALPLSGPELKASGSTGLTERVCILLRRRQRH